MKLGIIILLIMILHNNKYYIYIYHVFEIFYNGPCKYICIQSDQIVYCNIVMGITSTLVITLILYHPPCIYEGLYRFMGKYYDISITQYSRYYYNT